MTRIKVNLCPAHLEETEKNYDIEVIEKSDKQCHLCKSINTTKVKLKLRTPEDGLGNIGKDINMKVKDRKYQFKEDVKVEKQG